MNEEQLADLLIEHLDALLAGEPLPETVPAEVAELLVVAQTLSETALTPRPEFGPALKESLLGPTNGSSAAQGAGSTFSSPVLFIVVIGLLVTAAGLALVANLAIFETARSTLLESLSPTAPPSQTQTVPTQSPSVIQTPSLSTPTVPAIKPTLSAEPVTLPTLTVTPIIDVLPAITVTIEIRIEPPDLVPDPSSGSGGGSGGGGGSSGGSGGSGGGGGGDDDGGDGDD